VLLSYRQTRLGGKEKKPKKLEKCPQPQKPRFWVIIRVLRLFVCCFLESNKMDLAVSISERGRQNARKEQDKRTTVCAIRWGIIIKKKVRERDQVLSHIGWSNKLLPSTTKQSKRKKQEGCSFRFLCIYRETK